MFYAWENNQQSFEESRGDKTKIWINHRTQTSKQGYNEYNVTIKWLLAPSLLISCVSTDYNCSRTWSNWSLYPRLGKPNVHTLLSKFTTRKLLWTFKIITCNEWNASMQSALFICLFANLLIPPYHLTSRYRM